MGKVVEHHRTRTDSSLTEISDEAWDLLIHSLLFRTFSVISDKFSPISESLRYG